MPFGLANPLIHGPTELNKITARAVSAAHTYDGGLLSEPLTVLELYKTWQYRT